MRLVQVDVDEFLLKEFDETDCLYIVESGVLEIYLEVEGTKFVIETIKSGTVINYRNLFNDDEMLLNMKAVLPTFLWQLSESSITKLTKKDKLLEK